MTALPPDKRKRLVQLLGMLGSDFDGERANAGRMASDLIRSLGLTWDSVVAGAVSGSGDSDRSYRGNGGWEQQERARWEGKLPSEVAEFCLKAPVRWTEWERKFLDDMQYRATLSEKQSAVLQRMHAKAKAYSEFYKTQTEAPF